MIFDPVSIYSHYSGKSREGITDLITMINTDPEWVDLRQIAYVLATVQRETGATYKPIEEWGRGRGLKYGAIFKGHKWYGRGYVQLTWFDNYERADKKLRLNGELIKDPALALNPDIAYRILARGMREGWFTGLKLQEFIDGDRCNYTEARKIINGADRNKLIAGYAEKWEGLLAAAKIGGGVYQFPPEPALIRHGL